MRRTLAVLALGGLLLQACTETPQFPGGVHFVSGTVLHDGSPVAGAVVRLADGGRSVATDGAGRYCIATPANARVTLYVNHHPGQVSAVTWCGAVSLTTRAAAACGATQPIDIVLAATPI